MPSKPSGGHGSTDGFAMTGVRPRRRGGGGGQDTLTSVSEQLELHVRESQRNKRSGKGLNTVIQGKVNFDNHGR